MSAILSEDTRRCSSGNTRWAVAGVTPAGGEEALVGGTDRRHRTVVEKPQALGWGGGLVRDAESREGSAGFGGVPSSLGSFAPGTQGIA